MKKLLLTFSLAAMLLSAKSQIIITGVHADPGGTDASVSAGVKAYEYMQFKATQDINFATTNYAVIALYFGAVGSTPAPTAGWASGGAIVYQFNLTSGSVSKGDFFYVGGDGQTINGSGSTDISGAKWIKSVDYGKVVGDGLNAATRTGLFVNSNTANGIAVFNTTSITETTVPIDVVFWGTANANHYQVGPPELGFRICNNDLYSTANGAFFNKATNTAVTAATPYASNSFQKFGGVYDLETNTWTTPRSSTTIVLNSTSPLTAIESGTGITVLPVQLTSFTAKANKQGTVNLAWTTASEKDNSHFEVTRSANGVDFIKLDEVKGNGNSDIVRTYSYTDAKPVVGTNYYRLKQVDIDGKFAFSSVATAKVGLSSDNLTAAVSANRTSVAITYNALASGKALFNVYNISGAKIATVERNVNAGVNQISIPANLGNSLHVLSVSQAGATASTKF